MTRRIVVADSRTYVFSPDDPPALGQRFWAIVRTRVIDELTGQPPTSAITIESATLSVVPRVASDGLVGLVGIPQQVFPALNAQDYDVTLRIKAAGYIPQKASFTISKDSNFPNNFTSPLPAQLALHREPTVITGRVVRAVSGTTTPLAGATIRVTGIWRTPPPANMAVAPDPPNLISLRPPLYSDRGVVTGRLRPRNLPAILGDDKLLLDDVLKGANPIRLSNRQNLTPGDILLLDANKPDIAEYIAISTIGGASTATQPAAITLDYPLAYPHRRNALVQKVNPQPLGMQKQVAQEALVGDTCVFLNDVTGLTTGSQVRINGGPNPDEYHHLSLFSVTSDADGYYRLPPLSRVAQLNIRAEKAPLPPVEMEFRPNYDLSENRLDFIFR